LKIGFTFLNVGSNFAKGQKAEGATGIGVQATEILPVSPVVQRYFYVHLSQLLFTLGTKKTISAKFSKEFFATPYICLGRYGVPA
jgi:hypothetical protein